MVLLQFVLDNRKGQKYLLISVEHLIGEVFPSLLPKVAIILKAFYDNDILEEESILEWADKVKCLLVLGVAFTVNLTEA